MTDWVADTWEAVGTAWAIAAHAAWTSAVSNSWATLFEGENVNNGRRYKNDPQDGW